MPNRRILPQLEAEVGHVMHNKVVGDITTQVMRAMPSIPDRLVLIASVVAGVIYYSAKQESIATDPMIGIIVEEVKTALKRLQGRKK